MNFNDEHALKLLSQTSPEKYCKKNLKRLLKQTRKKLENDSNFTFEDDVQEQIFRWVYENFTAMEENIGNMGRETLSKSSKITGIYCFFEGVLDTQIPQTQEEILEIVNFINEKIKDIGFETSRHLAEIFLVCVYTEIFLIFNKEKTYDFCELDKITKLFILSDVLLKIPQSLLAASNPADKILLSDKSGVYEHLSEYSKESYRNNLIKLAKKNGVSEENLAKQIVLECGKKGEDMGIYLADKPSGGKEYLCILYFLAILFTMLLTAVSPWFVLAFVPVFFCSKVLLEKFYLRFFCRKSFCLPEIELDEIPDKHGVMTVITTLLTGKDDRIFERIEDIYHSNGGKNVYFGILADLLDSDCAFSDKDREIVESARKNILSLRRKYGDVFFFFVRERQYSKSEEAYIAPERKRGAVGALSAFLCGRSDMFCQESIKPGENICRNIKYVLTLDEDTIPEFDCVKSFAGIMMHPYNEPFFNREKGVVTKGYGILQPAVSTSLESLNESFFTKVMCGRGGVDNYSFGGSEKNMCLFGKSFFCGKGFFEKNVFYEAMFGKFSFEMESVLSHDLPEGARLRCAHVPQIVFTDSYPSEELAYYKRKHRWMRGDVQNIPFMGKRTKNADGETVENRICVFYRHILLENVMSALLPIFSVLLIFLSVFYKNGIGVLFVTVGLSAYVLPFVNIAFSGMKRILRSDFRRIFYSDGIYTLAEVCFLQMVFCISSLAMSAYVSADAVIRSLYRRFASHRKMLEWTTSSASDAEKKDGLLGYVKKNLPSALCGTLLFVLTQIGFVKLIALLWFFQPPLAYRTGKRKSKKAPPLSSVQAETLAGYCGDMWKFFAENVSEKTHFLPYDNIQFYPGGKVSSMTSPTNIGLYLLSCVCARKIGIIDTAQMEKRLCDTLLSVSKLEKYKGILYNWYDVFSAKPMRPEYLSSVDMGNFYACLTAVKGATEEFSDQMKNPLKIQSLIDEILSQAEISVLFDKSQNLFYIGAHAGGGQLVYDKNRYDMLMSEARILSYCSVAKRVVPKSHIKHLSRRFVEGKGYIGIASWSGTVFEYFMPELFFESKEGSLVYEALRFCFDASIRAGTMTENGFLFGISESCFNKFCDDGSYGYFAFGLEKTAMKTVKEMHVYSPYSVFLMMETDTEACLRTLIAYKKNGVYGQYGFYESADFENRCENETFSTVKCFMAHHLGMSIAAATNCLYNGVVREWFASDKAMKSVLPLTQEKIPYYTATTKMPRKRLKMCEKDKAQRCSVCSQESTENEKGNCTWQDKHTEELNCKRILFGRNFGCAVGENNLGFSFAGGDFHNPLTKSERLFFDDKKEFDLCLNCERSYFSKGFFAYEGNYGDSRYNVKVFVPENEPVKIIKVETDSETAPRLCIEQAEDSCENMVIGSGICWFSSERNKKTGFLFGCADSNIGAEYNVSSEVEAFFRHTADKTHGMASYIFCIGFAHEEDANSISSGLYKNISLLENASEQFDEKTTIDYSLSDKTLIRVLKKHFELPCDGRITGAFTEKNQDDMALNLLLSVYTKCDMSEKITDGLFTSETPVLKLLYCIAVSEFVRIWKKSEITEAERHGVTVYKKCLSVLFDKTESYRETKKTTAIFYAALMCFSNVCDGEGDMRTAIELRAAAKELSKDKKDDFFM